MILEQWDKGSISIVNSLVIVGCIVLAFTMYKVKDSQFSGFFMLIMFLLFLSQIFYGIFTAFTYKEVLLERHETGKGKTYKNLGFSFNGLYWIMFCCAHWVFSMRYWIVAYNLEYVANNNLQKPDSSRVLSIAHWVYYINLVPNICLPIYLAAELWAGNYK